VLRGSSAIVVIWTFVLYFCHSRSRRRIYIILCHIRAYNIAIIITNNRYILSLKWRTSENSIIRLFRLFQNDYAKNTVEINFHTKLKRNTSTYNYVHNVVLGDSASTCHACCPVCLLNATRKSRFNEHEHNRADWKEVFRCLVIAVRGVREVHSSLSQTTERVYLIQNVFGVDQLSIFKNPNVSLPKLTISPQYFIRSRWTSFLHCGTSQHPKRYALPVAGTVLLLSNRVFFS